MELTSSNEYMRKRQAILKQKLSVMNVSFHSAKDPAVKKSWEMQRDKAKQELVELDDALCRTEIITKFDLMEFE